MENLNTKYGSITAYENLERFPSGNPSSLFFTERVEIETPVGVIVPQYSVEDHGRQAWKPVQFFENGTIKQVPLQEEALIDTKYGKLPAELVLFYKDGSLRKIFPLNGKLSGYWEEKDEYKLTRELELDLPWGKISARLINLTFFKNGNIRSLTLWPRESIGAKTPAGTMPVRIGIALYEDGSVKSVEPAEPVAVNTPIGEITVYDNDPEGIMGDINSLQFDPQGNISSLSTTANTVELTGISGETFSYAPSEKSSLCSEHVKISVPLVIEFSGGKVRFNRNSSAEYALSEYSFKVGEYVKEAGNPQYVCS